MAIDTENKRRSAQKQASGVLRPLPDSSVSATDRAQCAWFYAGLSYAAAGSIMAYANIGGVWKQGVAYVNVGGVWKTVTAIASNIGGAWKNVA